jgi:hypothetical protein
MIRNPLDCIIAAALMLYPLGAPGAAAPLAEPASQWPDTPLVRLSALAIVETLNGELLSNESATATLDAWCAHHRLAADPRIVADRVWGEDKPVTAEQRARLRVGPEENVRYRRVRLRCGDHVLSEADNWYVPSRLTPDMNRALETSDIAFGRAVGALHFRRERLEARLLWHPLPEGWDMGKVSQPAGSGPLAIPAHVIEHRAILLAGDGTPFSEVVETYTSQILDFPAPSAGGARGAF